MDLIQLNFFQLNTLTIHPRAVVVAHLVERSLLILEVHGSNPVIGQIYIEHLFTCLLSAVLKINIKEAGNCPFFFFIKNTPPLTHHDLAF